MEIKFDLASEDRLGSHAFLFDIGFSDFLPFIKHDALSLSAKDDMRYEKVR